MTRVQYDEKILNILFAIAYQILFLNLLHLLIIPFNDIILNVFSDIKSNNIITIMKLENFRN